MRSSSIVHSMIAHSIELDETHDENVASVGSRNRKTLKPKLLKINEKNSNLYLDTLEQMNYEHNKTIISTSWIENYQNYPQKRKSYLSGGSRKRDVGKRP